MLYHLKPSGRAGIVLANGSMSSSQNSEGDIRRAMVEADVVEVMIALPGQLFFNTQIPACLWFLTRQKAARPGEVLFIDARKLGRMISRVQTEFPDEVIDRIAGTVAAWRDEADAEEYQDIPGYCRSVNLAEIAEHGHVLTPGATWERKRSRTTTKPLPRRCRSSPRSSASRWRRGRNSIS
jgi:type I restriction enzyme M protein